MAASSRTTICLTMIVKNEAHVIERCLASVKPLVSHWIIVDTGSTDGTQDKIRAFMEGVPGEVIERPWRNFAHNRSESIDLARGKADYNLVIDADDVLVYGDDFVLPELTLDCYHLRIVDAGTAYNRIHLFRNDKPFRYTGVLHEVIGCEGARPPGSLEGIVYRRICDGARSADPQKFYKDAATLERALVDEPNNARYMFYLAQSWRDAGELAKAVECYALRAKMGGWDEEVWCSLHQCARLSERLQADDDVVIAAYLRAFEFRPQRAEALCDLARCLRLRNRVVAAYPFARAASEIPRPSDILFVDESVYAWRALDEWGVSAYWAGRYREGLEATSRLLASSAVPESDRARIAANAKFCREKLGISSDTASARAQPQPV